MDKKKRSSNELQQIAETDGRYSVEALIFVFQSLDYLLSKIKNHRHVSGVELSLAVKEFAQRCFGLMARTVLEQWGIKCTDDIGHIVYLLIDHGWMKRTDDDSLEDFFDVYDFDEAFDKSYAIPEKPFLKQKPPKRKKG